MRDLFAAVEVAFADLYSIQEEIRSLNAQMRDSPSADDRKAIAVQLKDLQAEWNKAHDEYNGALDAYMAKLKIGKQPAHGPTHSTK